MSTNSDKVHFFRAILKTRLSLTVIALLKQHSPSTRHALINSRVVQSVKTYVLSPIYCLGRGNLTLENEAHHRLLAKNESCALRSLGSYLMEALRTKNSNQQVRISKVLCCLASRPLPLHRLASKK